LNEDDKYNLPLKTTDVLKEIEDNDKVKADHVTEYEWSEKITEKIAELDLSVEDNQGKIAAFKDHILVLEKQNKDSAAAKKANEEAFVASTLKQETLSQKTIDPQILKDKLTTIEDHNVIYNENVKWHAQDLKVERSISDSEDLTKKIADVDTEREQLIKAVKMPIAGLSFNSDGILLYQDIPFSQASDAEKIRVSVAIGIAMNPELKVLMIRNGSLLDENNLKMIGKMAQLKDAQLWVETVGKRDNCSIIMEDGFSRDPADVK
jgi:hypothetical protein